MSNRRPFGNTHIPRTADMIIDGLRVELHTPSKLDMRINRDGSEAVQGLPPYAKRDTYSVHDFDVPESWLPGRKLGANEGDFFAGVKVPGGLWMQYNHMMRDRFHTAVLVSVQGLNSLTGMRQEDLRLIQHGSTCPKHDVPFSYGRHCDQCGYEWPAQNYMSSNAQPSGMFWSDGWLRPGSKEVRQFFFTDDVSEGIAAQVIGEDRTFSLGIAVYRSVEPKPQTRRLARGGNILESGQVETCGAMAKGVKGGATRGGRMFFGGASRGPAPKVEIGAGALVRQQIHEDREDVTTFWQPTPAAVFTLNYAPEAFVYGLLKAPTYDPGDQRPAEGFMAGLNTGSAPKFNS